MSMAALETGRRGFISSLATAAGMSAFAGCATVFPRCRRAVRSYCSYRNRLIMSGDGFPDARFAVLGDTHLSMTDSREDPFRGYSGRMAGAYGKVRHFKTQVPSEPAVHFRQVLDAVKRIKADVLLLAGDITSFPSEAAVEFVREELDRSGLEWMYIAGNHDWHYEGMKGSSDALRREWTARRLSPLYKGEDPMFASRVINGVRYVAIDDSTYEVSEEQLAFFRQEASKKEPVVLFVHIPVYMPETSFRVMSAGNPGWCAKNDRVWQIERRERWPERGPSRSTKEFVEEVLGCENLAGVFAGHIHTQLIAESRGNIQMTCGLGAAADFLDVKLVS